MDKDQQLEIEVTPLAIDQIRLKFHGVPNDKGPDLLMDLVMVRQLINKLFDVLPEYKHVSRFTVPRKISYMLVGKTLTKEEAKGLKDLIDQAQKEN